MTATAHRHAPTDSPAGGPAAPRALAWLYVAGGLIGLVSSFMLVLDKLEKLQNPGFVPSCSINPVISCGSVMDTWQAGLFGFPNPIIGVAGFPVVVTAGAALLSGYRPPRWFWAGLQVATSLALVFIHWLIFSTLYKIGALCPYCMVVWVVTIAMFWYTTLHNLGGRTAGGLRGGLARFHSLVLVVWFLVIIGLILQRFWTYWTSLL